MKMSVSKATPAETQAMLDDHEREKKAEALIDAAKTSRAVTTETAAQTADPASYFLRYGYQSKWNEVSKNEYLITKQRAGKGSDVSSFHGRGIRGEVRLR